ncbi:hypothetical protein CQ12_30620 [Bradyrhizobium jicamae]|uniref:Phasin domain-containing protein n=1 Tax=Bradyrhizobium jicamae TaxID=280332 RepID=A0A0R3LN01_9BRAD|nr:hypothetical protein [Bradyrhizobium jicamae]KRR07149.1 hypothetical protein CQ12_30620 [Bradyrhizobium jicamae]
MAVDTTNANHSAREPQDASPQRKQIGVNALKPIVHFQVSMLRMWTDSIARFAGNYEKALQETATTVEEQTDKQRAA